MCFGDSLFQISTFYNRILIIKIFIFFIMEEFNLKNIKTAPGLTLTIKLGAATYIKSINDL